MRKQPKMVVWPVYIDLTKTLKEGRRIAKRYAVQNPRLDELRRAAEQLGLKPELEPELAHPAIPWNKAGRIRVVKDGSKRQILQKISQKVSAIRQQEKT